ncbi:MAG TPA: YaeQ family protein [Burkholderiales bacterium]|jgi:uncharacterized protein YaeQ|nr:YaeQ family protein [Burkholderiales bacterium]
MALKATIFKAALQIADMDRNYYQDHALTIARHPSETDERMMVRLLAFAVNASESLTFGRGLSADDEPDVCEKDLTGAIRTWIDVGQPDERRIRKASGRADQVLVYTYGPNDRSVWWDQARDKLEKLRNLTVVKLPSAATRELAKLADRNMRLTCTLQEGQAWLADEKNSVLVELEPLKVPAIAAR